MFYIQEYKYIVSKILLLNNNNFRRTFFLITVFHFLRERFSFINIIPFVKKDCNFPIQKLMCKLKCISITFSVKMYLNSFSTFNLFTK